MRVYLSREECPVGSVYLMFKTGKRGTDSDGGPIRVKCANSKNCQGDKMFTFLGITVAEWRAWLLDGAEIGVGLRCI